MDENITLFLEGIENLDNQIEAVYLFGSQARGTAHIGSDYDILMVVGQKNRELKNRLYDIAVDIFLKTEADISLKILRHKDFERLSASHSPFIKHVIEEGIKLV